MSKQPWWKRIVTRVYGRTPQPRTVKPSPMSIARSAGWTREEPGLWSHPVLGVVTRERDGTWKAEGEDGGAGFETMTEAMAFLTTALAPGEVLRMQMGNGDVVRVMAADLAAPAAAPQNTETAA